MPIKKVFESDKIVYRLRGTIPAAGFGQISYFDPPVNSLRIYDEYISTLRGMAVFRDPVNPLKVTLNLYCSMRTDNWPSWANETALIDANSGAFIGWNTATGPFGGGPGGPFAGLTMDHICTAPDGSVWGVDRSLWFYKLDPLSNNFYEHPINGFMFGANIGTYYGGGPIAADPTNDLILMKLGADGPSQVSVCRLSTGNFLRRVNICGSAVGFFVTRDQRAYVAARDGTLTAFNHLTGEVYGTLHTGLAHVNAIWGWDPYLRRILYCPKVADTLPDGDCNIRVYGYYPVPLPVGMTPPIPLKYPQKGKTVPVFNRVYGGTSEGIAGQTLTYTVGAAGATLSPARKATDNNGTVSVNLTSTAAGANSVTSQTTV